MNKKFFKIEKNSVINKLKFINLKKKKCYE